MTTKKSAPKKAAAKKKSSASSASTYTDPKLRDRLKAKILKGDKGGNAGEWSARKAQLLAAEYKKAGGGYLRGKKKETEGQKHLESWTEEKWTTSDGKPAIREGGTTRYLPKKAWDKLTPAQKKATNAKKRAGSRKGNQVVANTRAAKGARKKAAK